MAGLATGLAVAGVAFVALDRSDATRTPPMIVGALPPHMADRRSQLDRLDADISSQFTDLRPNVSRDDDTVTSKYLSDDGAQNQDEPRNGKCPAGELVVGLQLPADGDSANVGYVCGRPPHLHVE